jgi:hypothetical protein
MYNILLVNLVLTAGLAAVGKDEQREVKFLVLAPYADSIFGEPGWDGGPAVVPAVRLAVARINNRTDILPDYRIELVESNSGCEIEQAAFFGFVSRVFRSVREEGGNVVGVIGPGCSGATIVLGRLAVQDSVSMIHISPSATSPILTDTTTYNNTYRILSSALQYIDMFINLMEENEWQWKNVAVLYDSNRPYHVSIFNHLVNQSLPDSIGFVSGIDGFYFPLEDFPIQFRIVVLMTGAQLAREVICLAYHTSPQVLYPLHQWIIIEKTKEQFLKTVDFSVNGKPYKCSVDIMTAAIEGVIFSSFRLAREDRDSPTDVDLTYNEYVPLYERYLDDHLNQLTPAAREYEEGSEDYAISYYDATWALAFGLNRSFDQFSQKALANYMHGQPEETALIKNQLNGLEFSGLLGDVSFQNRTQDSSTVVDLYQCIESKCARIGYFNGKELTINETNNAQFISDRVELRIVSVHTAITAVALIITIMITFFTFGLHMMFIIYREEKSVKAKSFRLSHILFSGCYLLLLQVSLLAVSGSSSLQEENDTRRHIIVGVICNVTVWLNTLGITLILSTLAAQLWRLYRIFNHFTTRHVLLSDSSLTVVVMSLVSVALILLVTWTTYDPLLVEFKLDDIVYNGGDDPVLKMHIICSCEFFEVWIIVVLLLEFALLIAVLTFTILNGRVKRRHFKISGIGAFAYFVGPIWFTSTILSTIFKPLSLSTSYALGQIGMLSVVVLMCLVVFIPPVSPILSAWYHQLSSYCQSHQSSHS